MISIEKSAVYAGKYFLSDDCGSLHDDAGNLIYFYSYGDAEAARQSIAATASATQVFDSGAQRDTQSDKPRPDLIPPDALLRLGSHYTKGAEKYGENNWTKGIPFSRVYASLLRHALSYAAGDRSEDHLAAMAFGALTLMAYEERIEAGLLPASLNDMEEKD